MGSQSDWETMSHSSDILEQLGVAHETRIVSAHRTPKRLLQYGESARDRGLQVIIAGAGGAAAASAFGGGGGGATILGGCCEIKPSQIQLAKEIKSIGTFKVKLNLHSEIQSEISIKVIPEENTK